MGNWYDCNWKVPSDFPLKAFEEKYRSGTKIEELRLEFRLTKRQFEIVRDHLSLPRRTKRWRKYGANEAYTCQLLRAKASELVFGS